MGKKILGYYGDASRSLHFLAGVDVFYGVWRLLSRCS